MNTLLAIVVLIACIFTSTVLVANATGLPSDSEKTIYYFADSQPILDEDTLNETIANSEDYDGSYHTITYDIHYGLTNTQLETMFNEGYFDDIDADIIIFETKYLLADGYLLENIFGSFSAEDIIFVTTHEMAYYSTTTFLQYTTPVSDDGTRYLLCPFDDFATFINLSVMDMDMQLIYGDGVPGHLNNSCILVDYGFAGFPTSESSEEIYNNSINIQLLAMFIERTLGITFDDFADRNINILVNMGNDEFLNLTNGNIDTINDLESLKVYFQDTGIEWVYAITDYEFRGEFSSIIEQLDLDVLTNNDINKDLYTIPTYIMETDNSGNIPVITYADLLEAFELTPVDYGPYAQQLAETIASIL